MSQSIAKVSYKLIVGATPTTFSQNVTDDLNKGWSLYGNPFIAEGRYCQAVTMFVHEPSALWAEAIATNEVYNVAG